MQALARWHTVPQRAVIERGSVHVWHAKLDQLQPLRPLLDMLSQGEHARARMYRFDADRYRFVLARSLLRQLLSAYVGAPPAALEFDITCAFCGGAHGKPRLIGHGIALEFSFSYAANVALLAVTDSGPIGADIQPQPDVASCESLIAAAAST